MKKFSLIKHNIRQYADFKGVKIKEIYNKTGIVDGTLSNSSSMNEDNLLKFFSYYDDVNLEWLLTGIGDMVKKTNSNSSNSELLSLIKEQGNKIAVLNKENGKLEAKVEMLEQQINSMGAAQNGNIAPSSAAQAG